MDSSRQNGAFFVRLNEGRPSFLDQHDSHVLLDAHIRSPVEAVQVLPLLFVQLSAIDLVTGENFLSSVFVWLQVVRKGLVHLHRCHASEAGFVLISLAIYLLENGASRLVSFI